MARNRRHQRGEGPPASSDHDDACMVHKKCMDRAFRLPVFLSTTNTLNPRQQQFRYISFSVCGHPKGGGEKLGQT